jgi:hypothetical protein
MKNKKKVKAALVAAFKDGVAERVIPLHCVDTDSIEDRQGFVYKYDSIAKEIIRRSKPMREYPMLSIRKRDLPRLWKWYWPFGLKIKVNPKKCRAMSDGEKANFEEQFKEVVEKLKK